MEISHSRHFQINYGLWHLCSVTHKLSALPGVRFRSVGPKLIEKKMTKIKILS